MLFRQEVTTQTLSTGTAYAVFYSATIALGLIALVWSLKSKKINQLNPSEQVISARNSSKWWAITASFFSSAMGSWVLAAPAEVGRFAGWWGVVGYSIATAFPWAFLAVFGPRMRHLTNGRGFTCTDFVKVRLGLLLHILYTIFTLGSCFIIFVNEAITISSIFKTVSPGIKTLAITISMALITFSYTFMAGIRATLLTDRLQFFIVSLLLILGCISIYGLAMTDIPSSEIHNVGKSSMTGFVTFLVLNISCFFPTFMDPSSWSRMYAAKSEWDAKVGLLVAAGLLSIPMLFFGSVGIISEAAVRAGVVDASLEDVSPFFVLMILLKPAWSVVLLLLATCLSASTIDTVSSGFASVIAAEVGTRRLNYNWARLAAALVFVLALITAVQNPPSVMTLFMVANLGSTAMTPPLLLSLWTFVTPIGCGSGIVCGLLTIMSFGWARIGTFKGGFEWWLLPEGFYELSALWTFISAGVVTTGVTFGLSQIEFWIRPESRADQRERFLTLQKGLIPDEETELTQPLEPESDSFKATTVSSEIVV